MATIMNIINTEEFQLFFKLILISLLSGVIGFEREHLSKPAGFRTHVLVGISSVLVMVCGIKISDAYGNNNPLRMPAQLLSGIGFIGAGTILSNGFKVKGLTTASGLLAITCIGLLIGSGMYAYGIISTLVVYIILRYPYNSGKKNSSDKDFRFKITTKSPKDVMTLVNEIITDYEMDIRKVSINEKEDETTNYILYDCKTNEDFHKNNFLTNVIKLEQVKEVIEV